MLAKSARLSRSEFTTVFSRPQKRSHFPEYSVYHTPAPTFKASVVVGKKVAKQAVGRNRLRREVYGALAQYQANHPGVSGWYIIIMKPPLAKATKAQRQVVHQDILAQMTKSR